MLETNACPKCNHKKIAGPHYVTGRYHAKIGLQGMRSATLVAFCCANCGFTELYSDHRGKMNINSFGLFLTPEERAKYKATGRWTERKKTSSHTILCPHCGEILYKTQKFCSTCGKRVKARE